MYRGPLHLDVVVAGQEDDLVPSVEHLRQPPDEGHVALEDFFDGAGGLSRCVRGAKTMQGAAWMRLIGQGIDTQQVECIPVEDEANLSAAGGSILAEVVTQPCEIFIVEEIFEGVVPAGLGVDAPPHVQVAEDDEFVHRPQEKTFAGARSQNAACRETGESWEPTPYVQARL